MIFNIPNGFQTVEFQKEMTIERAEKLLSTREQYRYTCGMRISHGRAVLIQHGIKCPHCGAVTPAYKHFLNPYSPRGPRIPREFVEAWGSLQFSLFPNEKTELRLNEPVQEEFFKCPRCKYSSEPYTGENAVYIEANVDRGVVTLAFWNNAGAVDQSHPDEKLVFSLQSGRTIMTTTKDEAPFLREITHGSGCLGHESFWLAARNNRVRGHLVQALSRFSSDFKDLFSNELYIDAEDGDDKLRIAIQQAESLPGAVFAYAKHIPWNASSEQQYRMAIQMATEHLKNAVWGFGLCYALGKMCLTWNCNKLLDFAKIAASCLAALDGKEHMPFNVSIDTMDRWTAERLFLNYLGELISSLYPARGGIRHAATISDDFDIEDDSDCLEVDLMAMTVVLDSLIEGTEAFRQDILRRDEQMFLGEKYQ